MTLISLSPSGPSSYAHIVEVNCCCYCCCCSTENLNSVELCKRQKISIDDEFLPPRENESLGKGGFWTHYVLVVIAIDRPMDAQTTRLSKKKKCFCCCYCCCCRCCYFCDVWDYVVRLVRKKAQQLYSKQESESNCRSIHLIVFSNVHNNDIAPTPNATLQNLSWYS